MKAAILYWSKSGNTEKVSLAIKEGLETAGAQVDCLKIGEASGHYDGLIFNATLNRVQLTRLLVTLAYLS